MGCGLPISLCVHPHKGRGRGVCMYMQFVVLGHEYTPVTIVSTTKEPTVIFKGYRQLYKRKREVPTCKTHTKYSKYSLM